MGGNRHAVMSVQIAGLGSTTRGSGKLQILIATTNRGKLAEIVPLVEELPIEWLTLGHRAEWEAIAAPDETGRTFAENARLKARYYAAATGLPTVAEDSGLEIDALGGAPGVESARWGGVDSSYADKFELMYRMLAAAPAPERTARFVCAIALVRPLDSRPGASGPRERGSDVLFETRGVVEGQIAAEPRGSGGFGYDPIFYYRPFGCTLAEAADRKSEVSHRGQAFRALRAFLNGQ